MNFFHKFLKEVKAFSRRNWWVYIFYFVIIGIIAFSKKEDTLKVLGITSLHFTADVFIMMMFSAYSNQKYKEGNLFQITSAVIFIVAKLLSGVLDDKWQYLLTDPVYILAAVKNYKVHTNRARSVSFINTWTVSALCLCILVTVLSVDTWARVVLPYPATVIQLSGIFLFAIALSTTSPEKLRYNLSLFGLTVMIVGSGFEVGSSWSNGKLDGLAISYTLLPMTVLIYYLRKFRQYHPGSKLPPAGSRFPATGGFKGQEIKETHEPASL